MSSASQGTLFVVATPIGNLGDITLRAVDTLRAADRIVAEDTRRTRGLLSHLGITGKPVDRLDAHAEDVDVARIVTRLVEGERIALVTDAGTPVVSDPGSALVRAASEAGATVVPIPGASAVMAALSISGLGKGPGGFRFIGFLPRTGPNRRETIALIFATPEPVVLFESPQRMVATIADLAHIMPEREVVIARELTKLHEETLRGTLAELGALEEREWLGEITIVLGPRTITSTPGLSDAEIDARIDAEFARGRRAKDIAEVLALETSRPKRDMYERVIARRKSPG